MDAPILYDPSKHAYLIPSLASVHAECIISPSYTVATFTPPLSTPRIEAWWKARAAEVTACNRHIILQMAKSPKTDTEEVAGYVMLAMPQSETVPFNGVVEKLLVSPRWREKWIARRLMEILEEIAVRQNRTLLVDRGSPAEFIYPRLGYTKIGEIPRMQTSPVDGSLLEEVLFYKDLR